ncbi:antibiotic biosynthesis monooxygenase [Pseudomonas sp. DC3000-4b1]|uniref:antibiotic biosynthesis monooxygenase n=1 Tax=unclassified Pseudomonas TaxID=196821 RepID=UPI003CE6FA2E
MTEQSLITHRVILRTWPGRSSLVGSRLTRLVEQARTVPACLTMVTQRHPEDPRAWQLEMCWDNEQALGAWLAAPLADLFGELLNQRLVMHIDIQPGAAVAAPLRQAS